MAKRATKRQSKKEYTLTEFKAWLEGIEEMQPANWAPDQNQWAKIREKLMNIVEEVIEVEVPQRIAVPKAPAAPAAPMAPAAPAAPAAPPPQMRSALADVAVPEMTPAAAAALNGGNLPSEMITSTEGGKSKTPDIDTSSGSFASSFE